jgi:hypothetical protein
VGRGERRLLVMEKSKVSLKGFKQSINLKK